MIYFQNLSHITSLQLFAMNSCCPSAFPKKHKDDLSIDLNTIRSPKFKRISCQKHPLKSIGFNWFSSRKIQIKITLNQNRCTPQLEFRCSVVECAPYPLLADEIYERPLIIYTIIENISNKQKMFVRDKFYQNFLMQHFLQFFFSK